MGSIPVKRWGYRRGMMIASFSVSFASFRPAMSVNFSLPFSTIVSSIARRRHLLVELPSIQYNTIQYNIE